MAERAIQPAGAQLAGWAVVAAGSAAAIAFTSAGEPLPVRLLHHYYDAAHAVALGLVSAGAVLAWSRVRIARSGLIALVAVSLAVVWLAVRGDFAGWADRTAGEDGHPIARLVLACAAAGLLIPAAHLIARALARPRWRLLAIAAAFAAAVANHLLYPRAYEGLHLLLAWMAAVLAGSALVGARSPVAIRPALVAGALLVAAAPALLIRPPNDVVLAMRRHPGTALAPLLARALPRGDLRGPPITGEGAEWYRPRGDHAPVPASGPRLLPPGAIVIHLSIDAVRADLLTDPRWKGALPALERLRDSSVWFSQARSTGAQTVTTLTSLFAGTHYSQQMWSKRDSPTAQYWPRDDRSIRFPDVLGKAGVNTVNLATAWWLTGSSGVAGGFAETIKVKSETAGKAYAGARELMAAVLARVRRQPVGRDLYLFAHFMDPHYPYDRAGAAGSEMERYVAEIRMVDDQLAALIAALEAEDLWQRTVLVAMADHGEAFGEHDTTEHATTLYEEMLRVPILIRVPGLAPRPVTEPVSTIDLGPTILDLFGLASPGSMMGESLVPLLRGEDRRLTRPIAAEGRLKQALITRGGSKAIRDLAGDTVECYDLVRDPGETHNLCPDREADSDALDRLRRFFDVHTLTDDGYRPPYRK